LYFITNAAIAEYVLQITRNGYSIGDRYRLLLKKSNNLFIEVLEDAVMVSLSKEDKEKMYHEICKLVDFFNLN
jgi:hypothetical protein